MTASPEADVARTVRAFLCEELLWDGPADALTTDYPLLGERVLDSIGIFQLGAHLEERYGVTIADEDYVPANFATIDAIVGFLRAKGVGA